MSTKGQDATHFKNIDQTSDPRFFIEFLELRKTVEGEREVKELILHMLGVTAGARVLDVGCGLGDDAREIAAIVGAEGRVVGIDPSETMVTESNKRASGSGLTVEFRIGDVRKLDFPDASFDFVRTDRVLMFVSETETALSEIVRVLRPGGRVVASEIDHEMHFQDSHFPETSRKVWAVFAANQPQPRLGRELHRLFSEHGLRNVKTAPRVIRAPYKTQRRLTEGFLASAIACGQLDRAEIDTLLKDLEALDQARLFNDGVVIFTASGEKA